LVSADDRHFLAAADYMARKIPGAARVTIPDAGHASNLHQPAHFKPRRRGFPREPAEPGMIFGNYKLCSL
jgi:pimeloyl-ACP methyl ester carboxylesterase